MEKNTTEKVLGLVAAVVALVLGRIFLASDMLYFRMLVGIGFGYALSRGYFGFAGSVNRAFNTGSTRLLRGLLHLFVLTAAMSSVLYIGAEYKLGMSALEAFPGITKLPLNLGLFLGALVFGFGMTFTTCCATGVYTDTVTNPPKGLITMLFFGIGIFVGFPLQKTQSWISDPWFTSSEAAGRGIFMPDFFRNGPFKGYGCAFALTVLIAGIFYGAALFYEKHRAKKGTLSLPPSEARQAEVKPYDYSEFKFFSKRTYYYLFEQPWSFKATAMMIMILFSALMAVTGGGWGASTPMGFWFGRILKTFGMSIESITDYTMMAEGPFVTPFWQIPINVQNMGILMGTAIFYLTSGQLFGVVKGAFKRVRWWEMLLYAFGGFAMGMGTRLSHGCNVGAMYSPIGQMMLSGWFWLIFMIIGGILGNMTKKKIYEKME